jgi:ATP-dependent helicase HrpA
MTDGILLAETQSDRSLSAYDTIIVDEAHERSLNIDFILGILQTLIAKRSDLKIIITSATIDTEKFSKAFDHAPVIGVSGRMYPVDTQYLTSQKESEQNGEQTHVEIAAQAVKQILNQSHAGDILVFMPTEQDIRETCELIEGQRTPGVRILPLFARLTAVEQKRVFAHLSERKIIVATNVAETSITIPGIKYVIDSGLARISKYSPRTRTTSLPVMAVSKSSCDQRKGRCGRVQNGICIRLFAEEDYESRPQYTAPEVLRANLAEVILRMISLKLGEVSKFPFIDKPDLKSIRDGFDLLFELGAIEKKHRAKGKVQKSNSRGRTASATAKSSDSLVLTEKGRLMAKIPLDPRLSRMLIEASKTGCLLEMAIITAALSIQDPRERPAEKIEDASRTHAIFSDSHSDFIALLNIWHRYHGHQEKVKSNNQMKRFCREHYLSYKRMREWRDIHRQIATILKEHGIWKSALARQNSDSVTHRDFQATSYNYDAIHKAVLSGFLSNIAQKKEKNIFRAARGREIMIFPGSGLFNKGKSWIVAAEIVETSRVFARTVARIESNWLEEIAQDLCRRTYHSPHWEKNRGEVVATEQVSLFGLIIVPARKISFGKVDPQESANIFIQSALVNGEIRKPFAFLNHNMKLIHDVKDIEDRLRSRDILIDEHDMFEFYQKRLPGIYDIRTLAKFLKKKGSDQFLRMKKENLFRYQPDNGQLEQFPNRLKINNQSFECSYCFEPGGEDDGITLKVPSALAPAVQPQRIDWLIPGLYPQKVEALIKGLPKVYRKQLVPIRDTVNIIVRDMPQTPTLLVSALGEFIYRRFGVDIPSTAWSEESLPDYLKMRISIRTTNGKELRAGRDAAILRQNGDNLQESKSFEVLRKKWEIDRITHWDFGDLPDIVGDTGKKSVGWIAYPALQASDSTKYVNLRLFRQQDKALKIHKKGVTALYSLHFIKDMKFLKRQLALPADKIFLTDYFGGAKNLVEQICDRVSVELFARNIRTANAFYGHAESVVPKIFPMGRDLLDKVIPILMAYHSVRSQIYKLLLGKRKGSKAEAFFEALIEDLVRLVPKTFITIYGIQRLGHLERYINAIAVRAQRASVDYEKEQSKANEINEFTASMSKLIRNLTPAVSEEKRQAIEEYFWMVEEYKVSVFAQELKTAMPISAKRLKEKLKLIERMA